MRKYRSTAYVSVEVDVDDILADIETEKLAEVLAERRKDEIAPSLPEVRRAIAQIRRGDTLDAITTLEREFFPKWQTTDASKLAYMAMMGALTKPKASTTHGTEA